MPPKEKELAKYCRISKYIEKTDPEFYEILDDLCALSFLRSRRGHNGITFLYPSKEAIKTIGEMRYTDNIDKAIEIVLSHVVHDYLPTPADWIKKKKDIPNGFNKRLVVLDKTNSKSVHVATSKDAKDSVELVPDEKFKVLGHQTNQAIYHVQKGMLSPDPKAEAATFEFARKGAKEAVKAKGGGVNQRFYPPSTASLLKTLRSDASHMAKPRSADRSSLSESPALEELVSLLVFGEEHKEFKAEVAAFKQYLSPVPQLALIASYDFGILSDGLRVAWAAAGRPPVSQPVSEYFRLMRSAPALSAAPAPPTAVQINVSNASQTYKTDYEAHAARFARPVSAVKLLNYHYAMFYAVQHLFELESQVAAESEAGLKRSLVNEFIDCYNTLLDIMNGNSFLKLDGKSLLVKCTDADCLNSHMSIWYNSDLYRFGLTPASVDAASNSEPRVRPGQPNTFHPYMNAHMKAHYYDGQISYEWLAPILARLAEPKLAELLEASKTERARLQPPAAPAALAEAAK